MKYLCEVLEFLHKLIQSEYSKIILSFILGFLSNYGIAKLIEQQKLVKLRKFYLSWLKFSLENVSKQLLRLEKYKDILQSNTNFSGNLEFNKNQLDKISSLSKEELYDVFVLRKKGNNQENAKKLHELTECIDYLILFDKEIYVKYNEFRNEIKELSKALFSATFNFNSIVDRYILEYRKSMGAYTDQMIELKDGLGKKYTQSEIEMDPYLFFSEFVSPAREIFSNHLFFQQDDIIIKGRESTQEIYNIFNSKKDIQNKFSNILEHYIIQTKKTISSIQSKIEFFS